MIGRRLTDEPRHTPTPIELGSVANRVRVNAGLRVLAWNPSLAAAALDHARDLVASRRFSHTGSDGSDVMARVRRHSSEWQLLGENLASGQEVPGEAITGWLNSPGHRENLLRPEFTYHGTAVIPLSPRPMTLPGFMWVQVYGHPVQSPFRLLIR
ncbi:MAG: CAP domain-containing protein [Solirubrobacteraceae bacterium]|nr:CAP domain-containing protein [Solirubrobacteraceae bacterium]